MGQPTVVPGRGRPTAVLAWARHWFGRRTVIIGVVVSIGLIALGLRSQRYLGSGGGAHVRSDPGVAREKPVEPTRPDRAGGQDGAVRLDLDQQRAIGLRTVRVSTGAAYDVLSAPGRVAPNETQYAFITPRAAGVVRAVTAHVGQDVKAGDLLATIDSPEVGEARLELYTRLQALDIARAQADWQGKVYRSTLELLERLRKGETPETIHDALADRPVGENREKLMTAYAQYRLAVATMNRNRELYGQKLITTKQFEKVAADFEVARSTYQGLMDQTGYENRLADTRARQALKQAETSVRAAQERLRILGVKPDGTEPRVEGGKVVGVERDGILIDSKAKPGARPAAEPEKILPKGEKAAAVEPVGAHPDASPTPSDAPPISTYSIWAPFDGTILDREMIVPGVAVDITHRIFTIANLATVWIEASVHEGDFDRLARGRTGEVRFRSPAYPGREFVGRVIYTGDVVEEQSRTVKLLAEAENPDRLLKPGMFLEVEVLTPREAPAIRVPASALLTQSSRAFVFVQTGPDRFARRELVADAPRGDTAVVRRGLEPGDVVVVEGGAELKAMAAQVARTE